MKTDTPRTDNYRSQGREWLPLGIFEDVERENARLRESLQGMVDSYEYEASAENESLLKAKHILSNAQDHT